MNCDVLHPDLKTKCVLYKNHYDPVHLDRRGNKWLNPKIRTTSALLLQLFRDAADRIDVR